MRQPISIVGNDRNNVIRAGRTGGTLDGGRGADRYTGGDGPDTFVVTLGEGTKTIYYYTTTLEGAEDVVALIGDVPEIDDSNFRESGSNTTLTVGTTNVVFVNPRTSIALVDENGSEIYPPRGLDVERRQDNAVDRRRVLRRQSRRRQLQRSNFDDHRSTAQHRA